MQEVRQSQDFTNEPENQGPSESEHSPENEACPYPHYAEEDMQTLHVYLYEEKPPFWTKGRIADGAKGIVALLLIAGLCFISANPFYQVQTIRVPAHFTIQQFKVTRALVPTGKQEYPATRATGMLTIYNGSILTQQLPAHFFLTTTSGREVATSQAVVIPAANLPALGIATVPAYAVLAGSQGNIPPYAIQATYGASLALKNLSAFTGGQDASTKVVVTDTDKTTALEAARAQLALKQPNGLESSPCTETDSQQALNVTVTWVCQYVTYHVPKGAQVLSVHLSGNSVLLTVRMVMRFL